MDKRTLAELESVTRESLRQVDYNLVARILPRFFDAARRTQSLQRFFRWIASHNREFRTNLEPNYDKLRDEIGAVTEGASQGFNEVGDVLATSGLGKVVEKHIKALLETKITTSKDFPSLEIDIMIRAGFDRRILDRMIIDAKVRIRTQDQLRYQSELASISTKLEKAPSLLNHAVRSAPPIRRRIARGVIGAVGKVVAGGLMAGADLSLGMYANAQGILTPAPATISAAAAIAASIGVGLINGFAGADRLMSEDLSAAEPTGEIDEE